jgi:hypothetical protein
VAASAKTSSTRPAPKNSGAFDLTSAESGAALIVADATHGGLSLTLFDLAGNELQSQPLYDTKADSAPRGVTVIDEVVAATLGEQLAVSWLEHGATGGQLRGMTRKLLQAGDAVASPMGDILAPYATPRGNLSLATSDGRFLALTRARPTPCADSTQRDCVGFYFFRLEPAGNNRSGPPLAVPEPCAQNAVSFAVSGARWYYGVCSRETGKPVTTVFSIQNNPAYYARADRVLEGCLPIGAVAIGDDLVVAGDCAGTLRAVRLGGGDADSREVRVDRLEAVCQAGKPLIRQLGPDGLQLPLSGRRDRLEAFLPANFNLPQARAVWTGETLLVAGLLGSGMTLKGYRCDSTLLREVALR